MTQSKEIWRKASILAIGGGVAFWVANFAISLRILALGMVIGYLYKRLRCGAFPRHRSHAGNHA